MKKAEFVYDENDFNGTPRFTIKKDGTIEASILEAIPITEAIDNECIFFDKDDPSDTYCSKLKGFSIDKFIDDDGDRWECCTLNGVEVKAPW